MSIVVFCRSTMAHRLAKQEAFRLFERGFYPPDIAAELKINLRTAQRWCKEFKDEKQPNVATLSEQKTPEIAVAVSEEQKFISDSTNNQNFTAWLSKQWLDSAQKLAADHFFAHNNVRLKVQKILDEKLGEPELNLKSIHTLSLAMTRHLSGEREAASLELLDPNRAALCVEACGLIISDPTYQNELDEE